VAAVALGTWWWIRQRPATAPPVDATDDTPPST
jgi:hypothetical protein